TAMLTEADADDAARGSGEAIVFSDLPPIGAPAPPTLSEPLGAFAGPYLTDVEKLTFANGARALLWPTDNEPGRATVRVRFGNGLQAFSREEAPYVDLGQIALMSTGMGPLDQNDLDRITAGRKLG